MIILFINVSYDNIQRFIILVFLVFIYSLHDDFGLLYLYVYYSTQSNLLNIDFTTTTTTTITIITTTYIVLFYFVQILILTISQMISNTLQLLFSSTQVYPLFLFFFFQFFFHFPFFPCFFFSSPPTSNIFC